jgi:hypothetical protein
MPSPYPYVKPPAQLDPGKLVAECVAAGLPVIDVQGTGDGVETFNVLTSRTLTGDAVTPPTGEKATLDGVVAAHDGRPRRKRTLLAILTDIGNLSAAQQTAVWNDLTAGAVPKWKTTSSDQCVWAKGSQASTTTLEKQVAAAFYCRETGHEKYLVNPPFAPAVNIPGDEVIP